MPSPRLAYLVCATHRSGSNLLCQMLWHSGLAGFPQEAFSPTRMNIIADQHTPGVDPERDFPAYVTALMDARQTANGIFGAKMMWKHLPGVCAAYGGNSDKPWEVLRDVLPDLRCVWMRRRDVVRQAISLVKAKKSRVYNSLQIEDGRTKEPVELIYDFAAIDKEVKRFQAEDRAWEGFFKASGIKPAMVVYEDFVRDFDADIRRVLAFLDVDVAVDFHLPPTTYIRQSDATNDAWADHYSNDSRGG